jgi:hypothetical protein
MCILLVGPLLIALAALLGSTRLRKAPPERSQTGLRLLGSYVLLTVVFGIGTCYAGFFASNAGRTLRQVGWLSAAAVVASTAWHLVAIRRLPRTDLRLREAFEVDVRREHRWPVMLAIALVGAAAAATALIVFA